MERKTINSLEQRSDIGIIAMIIEAGEEGAKQFSMDGNISSGVSSVMT